MGEEKERIQINGTELNRILKEGEGTVILKEAGVHQKFLYDKDTIRIVNALIVYPVSDDNYFNDEFTKFGSIELIDVVFGYPIQFRSSTFKKLHFVNCQFLALARFINVNFRSRLSFDKTRFHSNLELSSCEGNELFLDSIRCPELHIHKGNLTSFVFRNSKVHGLAFTDAAIKKAFIEEECKVENLSSSGSTIGELSITFSAINNAALNLSQITSLKMNLSQIKNIGFEMSTISEELYINASSIKELRLGIRHFKKINLVKSSIRFLKVNTEIFKDSVLVLDGSTIYHLNFDSIRNSGSIRLLHIVSPGSSTLSILNSDLGKTDFIRCNFDKAVFHFTNSKIAESFLAETDFPRRVFSNNELNHHQAQLAFGQLHTAYQRQGDNVRASEYQAREIEAHYETIRWTTHFPTKLNLFLNKKSNNFGRNWIRGFFFSIALGLFFFYCLILSSEEFYFALNFSHVPDLLDAFLKFMNPLRHFETEALFSDKNPQVTPNPWSHIWDFAGRIFVAYGYYQTIQAFRRFGKK